MDLRSHSPYWLLKNGLINTYPSLSTDKKTDVAIIGAGITGALIAWHLFNEGFDVTVLDKRHVGMGSTAASTSLLQYEIDTPLVELAKKVGEKNAARSYRLCIDAIAGIEEICASLGDDVEFERKNSFQYASTKKDGKNLLKEFQLRKKHNIEIDWLTSSAIKNKFGFTSPCGVLSKEGAQINAYRFTHALLKKIAHRGLNVFDTTEVINITHHRNSVKLTTHLGHSVTAKHLVIACGYESQKYIPKKVEELNSTYAIISEPMDRTTFWYNNCLIWETAMPYLYLRTTADNRILIGGKDSEFSNPDKRDRIIPEKVRALEKSVFRLFPRIDFRTDFSWAGTFATTKDGLPFIGSIKERPRTSFALGFGGNGITFSLMAAQILRDHLIGKKNEDAAIFAFNR